MKKCIILPNFLIVYIDTLITCVQTEFLISKPVTQFHPQIGKVA